MTLTRHRSSINGQWVTKAYAKRNPYTTQSHLIELADEVSPMRDQLDFLIGCFENSAPEHKAEWQLEIQDELTYWRTRLEGEE